MILGDQFFSANKNFLGEILVARGVVTPEQLAQALEVQKKEAGFIGEILVNLGYAEERDIVVALIVQCNFAYIAIDKYELDRSVISLIPEDVARKYHLIPLDRVGDVLSVVMSNPLDISVKAEIQRLTHCRVAPFIATKVEIQRALNRWFGEHSRHGNV